jgi:hypothetical protein
MFLAACGYFTLSRSPTPFLQAARDYVKGYVFERGFKLCFETTWLDKPQG